MIDHDEKKRNYNYAFTSKIQFNIIKKIIHI